MYLHLYSVISLILAISTLFYNSGKYTTAKYVTTQNKNTNNLPSQLTGSGLVCWSSLLVTSFCLCDMNLLLLAYQLEKAFSSQ